MRDDELYDVFTGMTELQLSLYSRFHEGILFTLASGETREPKDVIEYLKGDVEVNIKSANIEETPTVFYAVEYGNKDIIKFLKKKNLRFDDTDANGEDVVSYCIDILYEYPYIIERYASKEQIQNLINNLSYILRTGLVKFSSRYQEEDIIEVFQNIQKDSKLIVDFEFKKYLKELENKIYNKII